MPTRLPGQPANATKPERKSWLGSAWETLTQAGLAELVLRLGTHVLLIALILLVAWGLKRIYLDQGPGGDREDALHLSGGWGSAGPRPTLTPTLLPVDLPAFRQFETAGLVGISRQPHLHTNAPSRGRETVTRYTVKEGDTLFGIAGQFDLKPETLLWANQETLADNPHSLRPGQELNILPVNGAYYRWSAGDGLNAVANFYSVTPETIINYPGNGLSPGTVGDWANPNIPAGTWLIIPGGRRAYVSWSAPVIPLDNPGVAKVLGPGACDSVPPGIAGSGAFIWPADNHYLSGFDYEPDANHPAIDIDGNEGSPVYAADSGVVVYAGWNNWGYGNVVVINHGNGWQTLYAHLSAYYVTCGMSVYQGNAIATIGATGNAAGAHLHFEMMYAGAKVNPFDYVR